MGPDRRDVDLRGAQGVQVGDGNVQLNLFVGAVRAGLRPDAYLEQVRRIAPPELLGRDEELAELARFCLAGDAGAYAWWRAGPWAGKSALLSTFVLDPPPGAKLVSFFITARLAAQDTREAFTDVMLEQLAALLGEPVPAVLPEATREAYLLDLMSQAASKCKDAGGRLVLVLDGLDEDHGVTVGPDVHSIAGLLPARPPSGMRIIVAGRPDPLVPDDVPDWHPLRDAGIIRPLTASPHAQGIQRLSRQELQRLLHGSKGEQDVLGLLAAARGGLTAWDLAELADVPRWEVAGILSSSAGRTFQARPSLLDPVTRRDVYLLGHEELQAAATDYFGSRLAGYHERLHNWAAAYRDREWPIETPEYLLSGYFGLLKDLSDLPRMTGYALDAGRHDRMLDLTGGDAAAIEEAVTTLDRVAAQADPDLASALALASHRDHLASRNAKIPYRLPAVWAVLGQLPRALAMASSIADPFQRTSALGEMVAVLAAAGQHRQAEDLAIQAQAVARTVTGSRMRAEALAFADWASAEARRHQCGEAAPARTEAAAQEAENLLEAATALSWAGRHRQAGALAEEAGTAARAIADPRMREDALASADSASARIRRDQRAGAPPVPVNAAAHANSNLFEHARSLADAATALVQAGRCQQAVATAAEAEAIARAITNHDVQASALRQIASAFAQAGGYGHAEAIARSFATPSMQASAMGEVARAIARAGHHQRAENLARDITDSRKRDTALADVAISLSSAGNHQRAEDLARDITTPGTQAYTLGEIASALAKAGYHEHAQDLAREITAPRPRARALTDIAASLAQAGDLRQAATAAAEAGAIARAITNEGTLSEVATAIAPTQFANRLAEIAKALAQAGQGEHAKPMAIQAEAIARTISDPGAQARTLAKIAATLSLAGDHQRAEDLARAITNPGAQAQALAQVAKTLAQAGHRKRAMTIAIQAEAVARTVTSSEQEGALTEVATALAWSGNPHHAEELTQSFISPNGQALTLTLRLATTLRLTQIATALAQAGHHQHSQATIRLIGDPGTRASAVADVAVALAETGHHRDATVTARHAGAQARCISAPYLRATTLAKVAEALGRSGQQEHAAFTATQAEAAARSIGDPPEQMMALINVAKAFAWSGDHQHAEATARAISDPKFQVSALTDVAVALAQAGRHQRAEAVARAITYPYARAGALAAVAETLALVGETERASCVAASTCALGEWTAAIMPVLLLVPSAHTLLVRMLEESSTLA